MNKISSTSFIYRGSLFLLVTLLMAVMACTEDVPNASPQISFMVSENPLVNQEVTFTNTSTKGSSFEWDFGDGNISTLENPTHVYLEAGRFTVTLIVFDGSKEDTFSQSISVLSLPTASFSVPEGTNYSIFPVEFTNTSVAANTYLWTFGDSNGSTSTNAHPSFLFDQEGTYVITMEASNDAGTTSFTETIEVCNFYLAGTYELSTDLSTFCGTNFSGTIDIVHEGAGIYSFSDWSFGGYRTCYDVNFDLAGTFFLEEKCGVLTLHNGSDQYGDAWSISTAISGNDLVINWRNLGMDSQERGISTITFPDGILFVLG